MDRGKTILIALGVQASIVLLCFCTAIQHKNLDSKDESLTHHLTVEAPKVAMSLPKAPIAALETVMDPPAVEAPSVYQLPPLAPLSVASDSAPQSSRVTTVTVARGDTLDKIAKVHSTSVEEILKENGLTNTLLQVGQVLRMPSIHLEAKAGGKDLSEYYVMRVGDTPWSVAKKQHLNVDELLKLNNLSEKKARCLKPGDRLRIR